MFGIKTFLAGLTIGGVTSLLAMQFHVINTNDGLIVLPRVNRPPVRSTYVDVRKWSLAMWRQHPEVAKAAVRYGRPDLLGGGVLNSVFPQQTDFQAEPASNSETGKAKLALDALVPIKFTNPNGTENVIESKVPDPIFPFAKNQPQNAAQTTPPAGSSQLNHRTSNGVGNTVQPVFPGNVRVNDANLSGLPKLQNPIPIFDDVNTRTQNQRSQAKYNPQPKSDIFTDVLRALIPQNEQASTNSYRQHNAARPAFGIEAPNPNQRSVNPRQQKPPWQINKQNATPVVRPF